MCYAVNWEKPGKSHLPTLPSPYPNFSLLPRCLTAGKKSTMGLYWIAFSRYHFLKIGRHLLEEVIILC